MLIIKKIFLGFLIIFLLFGAYAVHAGVAVVQVKSPDTQLWIPVPIALGQLAASFIKLPLSKREKFRELLQYRELLQEGVNELVNMPDADLVVGVLPPRWYAINLNDPTVLGLELHAVRSVVSSQVNAGSSTLAHEIGHTFGLLDEYNFDVSPPKIGNRINVPGYWLAKSLQIGTGGNPIYYSFMGAEDAASRYWVDRNSYMAILQKLQSGAGP